MASLNRAENLTVAPPSHLRHLLRGPYAAPVEARSPRILTEGEEAGVAVLDDLLTRLHGDASLPGNGTYRPLERDAGRSTGASDDALEAVAV